MKWSSWSVELGVSGNVKGAAGFRGHEFKPKWYMAPATMAAQVPAEAGRGLMLTRAVFISAQRERQGLEAVCKGGNSYCGCKLAGW